jgi:cytochrome b561
MKHPSSVSVFHASAFPNVDIADVAAPPAHPHRHGMATIALHWASAAAILVAIGAILVHQAVEDQALRLILINLHRQAGLLVMVALVLRLGVRFTQGMADFTRDMPPLLHLAAKGAHLALYAALLALPALGWATANAHGVQLNLLGLLQLPMLVADDADLADTLSDWHAWAAWSLLALVAAHVVAACWHHWVRRDGVLAAMLPLVQPRKR